jgi:hypothetical protein
MPLYCICKAARCQAKCHLRGKACSERVTGGARGLLTCAKCKPRPAAIKLEANQTSPKKRQRAAIKLEDDLTPPKTATKLEDDLTPPKKQRAANGPPPSAQNLLDPDALPACRLRPTESGEERDMQHQMMPYVALLMDKAQYMLGEENVWHFTSQVFAFFRRFAAKAPPVKTGCPIEATLGHNNVTVPEFVAALGHLSAAFVADPAEGVATVAHTGESPPKVGPAVMAFKAWCLTALDCGEEKVVNVACWILEYC